MTRGQKSQKEEEPSRKRRQMCKVQGGIVFESCRIKQASEGRVEGGRRGGKGPEEDTGNCFRSCLPLSGRQEGLRRLERGCVVLSLLIGFFLWLCVDWVRRWRTNHQADKVGGMIWEKVAEVKSTQMPRLQCLAIETGGAGPVDCV